MSSEVVISLQEVGKCYQIYDRPGDRLLQMLARGRKMYYREFWALRNINLQIRAGEVVGVIGRNGSGKSTLLQLVCGNLDATLGEISVKGRIAALLELGAGFNPEFTGRENVYLSATLSGLSEAEIDASLDDIIDFSGIRDFIDQPVKTYSSGMYVRLAFSVAINVDPDILIIDEALSVGDGEFSRRSFDRIMDLKAAGKTILFCSHALYQVEALCNYVVWLDHGAVQKAGDAGEVINAYSTFLANPDGLHKSERPVPVEEAPAEVEKANNEHSTARITLVELSVNDLPPEKHIRVLSRQDNVTVKVGFVSDLDRPVPSVGFVISDENEQNITSAGSHIDQYSIARNDKGYSEAQITFPAFPLLKGEYLLYVFLLCENGIHVYDVVHAVARITVRQNDIEQGVVSIPHIWGEDRSQSGR